MGQKKGTVFVFICLWYLNWLSQSWPAHVLAPSTMLFLQDFQHSPYPEEYRIQIAISCYALTEHTAEQRLFQLKKWWMKHWRPALPLNVWWYFNVHIAVLKCRRGEMCSGRRN